MQTARLRLLEISYEISRSILHRLKPLLRRNRVTSTVFVGIETVTKNPLFNCKMCGQCILHSTGMVCPMNCPKNLRNGPCGGVRQNGNCEIQPNMKCVWVRAWDQSKKMRNHQEDIYTIQKPLDRRLTGSSAWLNDIHSSSR